jgi:signal transduction histidine kinase
MDPEQLHQVMLNLVLNGIQSMDQEGRITIQARVQPGSGAPNRPDQVEISVGDTGGGISREQMEKIFRPFYTTKRGGTGLGLSLCRRIISQHGGALTAESEIGKGSRFIIRLPMREAAEEAQVLRAGD